MENGKWKVENSIIIIGGSGEVELMWQCDNMIM
jgi:hypothetical protein